MDDEQEDQRLSMYGESPTEADIDERHPLAPLLRALLRWRLATPEERAEIWGGDAPSWP